MNAAEIEHVNITVPDAEATARTLCDLFGWHVRWKGSVLEGRGFTVHVGSDRSYLALYTPREDLAQADGKYSAYGTLNHVGVTVDDLDAAEKRIRDAGFETYMHADYEPGRRFYFKDGNDVEIEVVSYA